MNIPGKYEMKLKQLLDYVSQEDIFELVIGDYPQIGECYHSPFRVDRNPKCEFEYDPNGVLRFRDWADQENNRLDCFEAVKNKFNLTSYLEVIHFIYDSLLSDKSSEGLKEQQERALVSKQNNKYTKKKTEIMVHRRKFSHRDFSFWSKYGITETELEQDRIYPVDKTYINSEKNGENIIYSEKKLAYADVSYTSGNRKVYYPESSKLRFVTNCTNNDVGNMQNISQEYNYLLITKSHKDHRVIKNQGLVNTVYFSNEGQFPEEELLIKLLGPYNTIYIFFDSDSAGIKASERLKHKIWQLFPEKYVIEIFTDTQEKDIADYYVSQGSEKCRNFLYSRIKQT